MKVYTNTGELARFTKEQKDPSWFASLRTRALEKFQASRWPTFQDEEWRRTSVGDFDLDNLSYSEVGETTPVGISEKELGESGYSGNLIISNGTSQYRGLLPDLLEKGVIFSDLGTFFSTNESGNSKAAAALIQGYEQALESADNKVFQWGLAAINHGAVLYVPKNLTLEKPFRITMKADGEDYATFPLVVVVLEEGAKAIVELSWEGQGGFLINQSNIFVVGDAANLSFTSIQKSKEDVVIFTNGKSLVNRDAQFRHFEAILGGGFVKNRIDSSLLGPGSDLELDGIYFADGERHMDLRTVQHHYSHHAVSNTVYRGAVADEARTIYQGLIEVSPTANGTDAYLNNKNLVLNDGARADSIPCLQINTDDVRCSHGSTTGKLRADQVFYLMTRGYSQAQAQEALILAYFQEVIGKVHESVQEEIYDIMNEQISRVTPDLMS